MSNPNNWNEKVIADFRANDGRVGGPFEGAPMVLVHHRGRRTGHEYVNPMMYLASERGDGAIYVFASKGGAPTNPDWYYNLTAAGAGSDLRRAGPPLPRFRRVRGEDRRGADDPGAGADPGLSARRRPLGRGPGVPAARPVRRDGGQAGMAASTRVRAAATVSATADGSWSSQVVAAIPS